MDVVTFVLSKSYTDSVALYGVPINYPRINPTTKHWELFNPSIPGFVDSGVLAEAHNIELRVMEPFLQWRLEGFQYWNELFDLSTLKGKDGKSAYELALQAGFSGTIEQWIASLHGKNGEAPQFRTQGNTVQYRFTNFEPSVWTDLYTFTPSEGGGNSGPVNWDHIKNKPDEFPPQEHDHTLSDITDFDSSEFALKTDIPDVSDFITESDIPTNVSAFENDKNYATTAQVATAKGEAIQAAANNTDEKVADAKLATQKWMPAVQTKSALPGALTSTSFTYLCRVLHDPTPSNNGVWQAIPIDANNHAANWTWFGDNQDFIDELELEEKLTIPLAAETGSGADTTTVAVPATIIGNLLQTIWHKIRQVVNVLNGKQDRLVSGENIKTINGESLLDGGDLSVSDGAILAGNNTFTGENIFEGDLFLLKDGVFHNVGEQIARLFDQLPTVIEVPYGSELNLTRDVLENYAWFEVIGRHRMAFGQSGVQYPDSPKIFDYAKFTVQYNKWQNCYGALFLYGIENNVFQNMVNAPSVNMGVTITPLDPDSYDIDEPRPVLVCLHGGMPIGSSS